MKSPKHSARSPTSPSPSLQRSLSRKAVSRSTIDEYCPEPTFASFSARNLMALFHLLELCVFAILANFFDWDILSIITLGLVSLIQVVMAYCSAIDDERALKATRVLHPLLLLCTISVELFLAITNRGEKGILISLVILLLISIFFFAVIFHCRQLKIHQLRKLKKILRYVSKVTQSPLSKV